MVIVWWTAVGLIQHSLLNPDKTITIEKYCQQIEEMQKKITTGVDPQKLTDPSLQKRQTTRRTPAILMELFAYRLPFKHSNYFKAVRLLSCGKC